MNKIIIYLFFLSFAGIILFLSCKKEYSCENCAVTPPGSANKPPIANAGPDQTIILPIDSIRLDGSASHDPDGTISSYKWLRISGPVSSNIARPDSSKTLVKTLLMGVYKFELTVTDNGGLIGKDTIKVMVDNPAVNQPPIACAGADQVITLPVNTVTLNGICSSDPDNNIVTYVWAKISGPASYNIANANAIQTQVINLVQGVYQFELKVTDAGGLLSNDTVKVMINPSVVVYTCGDTNRIHINAQLIPIGTLSDTRSGMTVASAGNKILFAGGCCNRSRVDIYDITTQAWSIAELTVARYDIAAVATGNKIFFGGGEIGDGTSPVNTVDIYDASTNTWSTSALSVPGHSIAAVAVGNKVFFAGGDGGFTGWWNRSITVDIFDLITSTWSTAQLSSEGKRNGISAVTVNNKIYIAGGEAWTPNFGNWFCTNRIDIYDNTTNSWSSSSLAEGKLAHAGVEANGKIYWAGGVTGGYPSIYNSCSVEIRDISTGSSSIQQLSSPATWNIDGGQNAVVKNGKIVFMGDHPTHTNKFDIYDIATNSWSIGVLPVTINGASIISVNNTIYIAGGWVNNVISNQVWKLEF